MFVPPLRTLGFNPQLTMNDQLLAQSYVEAYDISYPEAMRRIESEVAELKQQLNNEGYYEMNGIGVLSLNDDSRMVFTPCEAGLLTPSLYGLSAFEMTPLGQTAEKRAMATIKEMATVKADTPADETVDEPATNTGDKAITIKMSWLRNAAAVAAAILLFLLQAPPVANSDIATTTQIANSPVEELLPMPKKAEPKKLDTSVVINKQDTSLAAPTVAIADTQEETTEQKQATAKEETTVEEGPTYCLVLASQVAQQGAENLVKQMKQRGYDDTRINMHKNIRRVVYGYYDTEGAAYQALNKLRSSSSDFDEAWVYKTN